MKFSITLFMTTFLFLSASLTGNAQNSSNVYHVEQSSSKLFWKGTKTIGTKHFGFMNFNQGWIRLNSKGAYTDGFFILDMASITSTEHYLKGQSKSTKDLEIEKELKSISFFDVKKYPTASIKITQIVPSPQINIYRVYGDLTIKNQTHEIIFNAQLINKEKQIFANATLTIDRQKWGIHTGKEASLSDQIFGSIKEKLIADEIPITIKLILHKK